MISHFFRFSSRRRCTLFFDTNYYINPVFDQSQTTEFVFPPFPIFENSRQLLAIYYNVVRDVYENYRFRRYDCFPSERPSCAFCRTLEKFLCHSYSFVFRLLSCNADRIPGIIDNGAFHSKRNMFGQIINSIDRGGFKYFTFPIPRLIISTA